MPDRLIVPTDVSAKVVDAKQKNLAPRIMSYSAYGNTDSSGIKGTSVCFNGELLIGGLYLLGAGYRAYSPRLMRFYSADRFSPFDLGGINCYAYCSADPVNFVDPNGQTKIRRIAHTQKTTKPIEFSKEPTKPTVDQHGRQSRVTKEYRRAWYQKNAKRVAEYREHYNQSVGLAHKNVDPRIATRGEPTLTVAEANTLFDWLIVEPSTFQHLNKKWSQVARYIVVEYRLEGNNPSDGLRKAFPKMPEGKIHNMAYSVARHINEIRKISARNLK